MKRNPVAAAVAARRASYAFSQDDGASLTLLLLPVTALTLALAAVQSWAPHDTARRQLAVLPAATTVRSAAPAASVSAAWKGTTEVTASHGEAERTLRQIIERPRVLAALGAPSPVPSIAVHDTAATIPADMQLDGLPPDSTVIAALGSLGHPDRCVASVPASKPEPVSGVGPDAFGRMLAAAARKQTEDLVVYTDKYRDMGFPMGDVRPLYGVCTDVVVRAYRTLGIDLQVLVHDAKLGTGDPAIDHRRVETLRRFFGKFGTSIPVTSFVEEFQPGDIVTYRRPEGRGSQTHIGIVSDVVAPSGRPMIVHNRGWGPLLEDALFANPMTGHYRYGGAGAQTVSRPTPPLPVPHRAAQTPWPGAARLKVSAKATAAN